MSKSYKKMYYIEGKIFKESTNKKAYNFAKKYAKDNGLDEDKIYEISNTSEQAFLEYLIDEQKDKRIVGFSTHEKIELVEKFENYNHEEMPSLTMEVSFTFISSGNYKKHYVKVVDSVYELDKHFIDLKILFDYLFVEGAYLEVYYLDDEGNWKKWNIKDKDLFIKERKEQHKKKLAQMRAIRGRQTYDRLLRLRSEGKATERQLQKLYELEKVYGGKNG